MKYILLFLLEQTKEELIRMRKFSMEIEELLSYQPRFGMLFSKFIPAFHHHFGHQCRVGDYGFNKLIELLEALQDIIQVCVFSVSLTYLKQCKHLVQHLNTIL